MKGSMREKRPGYWELRVFEGADPLTGKRKYRTKVFRGTKRQAQSALAVLVTEVDGGIQRQRIVRDTKNHGIRWVGLDPERPSYCAGTGTVPSSWATWPARP